MHIIRLTRRFGKKDDAPMVMWLTSEIPLRWGERVRALRYQTKGAARRFAGTIHVSGAWSVEED
jgi:hypothetical protein